MAHIHIEAHALDEIEADLKAAGITVTAIDAPWDYLLEGTRPALEVALLEHWGYDSPTMVDEWPDVKARIDDSDATAVEHITMAQLAQSVGTDDLNEAVAMLQQAAGIVSGDLAGIMFCGAWEDEWPTAKPGRRAEMLREWLAAEDREMKEARNG
jgi:hypothetical protein